jgi:hypothetical protein
MPFQASCLIPGGVNGPRFENGAIRERPGVSPDPGHENGSSLGLEELVGLFEMCGNALEELRSLEDPTLQPLLRELLELRGALGGAMSQLGPSLTN